MSLVFCIISILQEFPYFASAISLDFAGFFRFFPLLFTHACPATEFCRCFAFQIGKICCHNCIVRNFQFRKFLPVYSNIFLCFLQYMSDVFWFFSFSHKKSRGKLCIIFPCNPAVYSVITMIRSFPWRNHQTDDSGVDVPDPDFLFS